MKIMEKVFEKGVESFEVAIEMYRNGDSSNFQSGCNNNDNSRVDGDSFRGYRENLGNNYTGNDRRKQSFPISSSINIDVIIGQRRTPSLSFKTDN